MATQERSFSFNAILTMFAWAVPAITALIAVPITVRGLGARQYGLLALTASLTGYLGLLSMGLGSAIIRHISHCRVTNEGRPMIDVLMFALHWFSAGSQRPRSPTAWRGGGRLLPGAVCTGVARQRDAHARGSGGLPHRVRDVRAQGRGRRQAPVRVHVAAVLPFRFRRRRRLVHVRLPASAILGEQGVREHGRRGSCALRPVSGVHAANFLHYGHKHILELSS
jgi:hypothetical protein